MKRYNMSWTYFNLVLASCLIFLAGIANVKAQPLAVAGESAQPQAEVTRPSIESIKGAVQSGAEVLRVDLTQALTDVPQGFSIKTPARIVLDLPGVVSSLGRSALDINQGNMVSVSVVQSGERSRLVLNLKQATNYMAHLEGKALLVVLEPVVSQTLEAGAPTVFAENKNRNIAPIKDIDFRTGVNGSGRVVVNLPNNQVGVDIRQRGQTLVVEFMKSTLPEGLKRRLDVTDFGTPVQSVTTFQVGDRVRMLIEPKGNWEHSAYQSDDQFVVEVKQTKVDPAKLTPGVGYSGEKMSLNFQNIEIRTLLQVFSEHTGFNIVTSDSVVGNVTLRLQDVPWDQALEIVLQSKGLGVRKSGNVMWIAPKDEIIAKEKLERESNVALENLEPLRTQSFVLNYAKAADLLKVLTGQGAGGAGGGVPSAAPGTAAPRLLSPRGSAISDSRTNQLFVTDVSSRLEAIQELISKTDIAIRQVLIEARIVEASDSFSRSLGVRLGGGGNAVDAATTQGGIQFGPSYAAGSVGAGPGSFVNLPASGATGTFAVSIFGEGAARFLNLEISAMEADGKGKIVSSPRVVTADKVSAVIEQGTELPYQVASASGATSIAFRKANLKLEVTPQITPEGNVILELDINKDSVGQLTTAGYAIDTKHVKTQVLVENGGTVVIGGIFTSIETNNESKIPFLGDIPILGNLFKGSTRSSDKKELLVFITPKMISDKAAVR